MDLSKEVLNIDFGQGVTFDQNQYLLLHLRDPSHIYSEIEVQGYGMTFKLCNLGSKQPYFNTAYVVRVPIFSFTTVRYIFLKKIKELFYCTNQV